MLVERTGGIGVSGYSLNEGRQLPEWIDLALLVSEAELAAAIDALSDGERFEITSKLSSVLHIDRRDLEKKVLRLLVERARPLALPASLWARPITATTSIPTEAREHLARLGIDTTEKRVKAAQQLYAQFVIERRKIPVTEKDLTAQGYRCGYCGLAFCDEEVGAAGLTSPFGARGPAKADRFKPHWHSDEHRTPTIDHVWPVKLYGDNDRSNLRVICRGCNEGKANFLAVAQTRPFIGLPVRAQLTGTLPIPLELFFAQIWREPQCSRTGRHAHETELTVDLHDPRGAVVLDNLITVQSPGL